MTWYSIGPRDRIIVKDYVLFSVAKNIHKTFCKNISKSLSCKCS